jgi:hypothetical protein
LRRLAAVLCLACVLQVAGGLPASSEAQAGEPPGAGEGEGGAAREKSDEVLVLVNGEPLMRSRLNALMAPIMRMRPPEGQLRWYRRTALAFLVQEMLLDQHLRSVGYAPSSREVAREIERKKEVYDEGLRPGRKTFEEELRARGTSLEKMRTGPPPGIRFSCYLASIVEEDELRKAFDEDPALFSGREVHARHILVKVERGATEEDKETARKKAEEIRSRALAGGDFAELAKELSDDAGTRNKGGDLGFIDRTWRRYGEDFARAAMALGKNETSQVVESWQGLHVIQAGQVKEGKPFREVREGVLVQVAKERAGKLYEELLEKAEFEPPEADGA